MLIQNIYYRSGLFSGNSKSPSLNYHIYSILETFPEISGLFMYLYTETPEFLSIWKHSIIIITFFNHEPIHVHGVFLSKFVKVNAKEI